MGTLWGLTRGIELLVADGVLVRVGGGSTRKDVLSWMKYQVSR
jgi:hypothetical protein